jgi:peptidyl-prolyl cis-trans isomerase A (cyclophilin A)
MSAHLSCASGGSQSVLNTWTPVIRRRAAAMARPGRVDKPKDIESNIPKGPHMKSLILAALLLIPVSAFAQRDPPKEPGRGKEALKEPSKVKDRAPDTFKAKFETTKGDFILEVHRDWSPNGADRFYALVRRGFFDGVKFFRVVPNFVVQFGIHGDPDLAMKWLNSNIQDDKVVESNKRGFITYAKSGQPNSRSTQLFINLKDNDRLDSMGFSPFGKVIKGMDVVDKLYNGYEEQLTSLQGEIATKGNAFLEKEWPKLDGIKKATIVK